MDEKKQVVNFETHLRNTDGENNTNTQTKEAIGFDLPNFALSPRHDKNKFEQERAMQKKEESQKKLLDNELEMCFDILFKDIINEFLLYCGKDNNRNCYDFGFTNFFKTFRISDPTRCACCLAQ